jgi:hypothetical protein
MPDYSQGKIYKIEPICEHEENEIYIGSTTLKYLSSRMCYHKTSYNRWKSNTHGKVMSFELFDKYGFDNCVITLIENVDTNTKDELLQKERHYIQSMKCINKFIPLRTQKEYYLDNKEHRQHICKEYHETHKEEIAEYHKKWRAENKELKKDLDKQYRESNQEKIKSRKSEKITCECGLIICRDGLSRHKKSQFHINNIS